MLLSPPPLKPRKSPVQARSRATLDVIHAATIQILATKGLSLCTTTRVAERAGVSVGSLYQYYPNRGSLLMAVLERHIDHVASAVEKACAAQRGKTLSEMTHVLTAAFIGAKLEHVAASRCLYAVSEEPDGAVLVAGAKARTRQAVASMLETAVDGHFADLDMVSLLIMSAMVGPVQTLLEEDAPAARSDALEAHLRTLIEAYLRAVSIRPAPAQRQ